MTIAIPADDVAALRAFNRFYTRKLGLLNAHLDRSPFTLAEARVLCELAHRTDPTAAEIMRALGLDRAQISRTLKRFGGRGLVATRPSADHGSHRLLSLTKAGRAAFAALDCSTVAVIGELPPARRRRLLTAAADIRGVFDDPATGAPILREPAPGDLGWVVHRQAALYAEEYGWNNEYEALVARILADFVASFDPAREAAWVAEIDGRIVGSVFLVRGDAPDAGKLRLLYVEPDARGSGVGGGSSQPASSAPAPSATVGWSCGRTASSSRRAGSTSVPASHCSRRRRTARSARNSSARPGRSTL